MRAALVICLLCLMGCDSPGLGYGQATVTRVQHGGNHFTVRRSGVLVRIIRTNFLRRPDINKIGRDAESVVEDLYGCPVTTMTGDVALMTAKIDCSKPLVPGQRARWVKPRRNKVTCLGDLLSTSDLGRETIEFSCL